MFERLTVYIDGEAREDHSRDTGKWKNGSRECMARLAAYEDAGLTPDEIAALRAENAAFKADIEAGRLVRILCHCERCEYWGKEYIAPNPDFHLCKYNQVFTPSWHYCANAYNRAALDVQDDSTRMDGQKGTPDGEETDGV